MNDAATGRADQRRRWGLLIAGAAVGLLHGTVIRLLARVFPRYYSFFVMTTGFTCFLPLAMGFVAVYLAEIKQQQRVWIWLLLPWAPLAMGLAAAMLMLLEGFICVVMFAPLGMLLSSVGGLLGGWMARSVQSHRSRNTTLACVMVLPFMIAPWEGQVLYHLELRNVENVVDIHAPASVVWRSIERVPAIRSDELPSSWSHRIGFPDPIEATLTHEGIGGIRHATFAGGVVFIETIDVWEPQRRLAFSIRADEIPKTTLDDHVTIGGPYFDVLRGEYRLEPLSNGVTRLHLSSRHRLSTDFNWYAHLWTDAVMSDLQKRILHVVRQRCERAAVADRR